MMEQVKMVQLSGYVAEMLLSRWFSFISSVMRGIQQEMTQISLIRFRFFFCVANREYIETLFFLLKSHFLELIMFLH